MDPKFDKIRNAALKYHEEFGKALVDDEVTKFKFMEYTFLPWVEWQQGAHKGKKLMEILLESMSYGYYLLRDPASSSGLAAGLPDRTAESPLRVAQTLCLQAFQILYTKLYDTSYRGRGGCQ